jgi:hypothetical protein
MDGDVLRVVISYAHQDAQARDLILKALKPLDHDGQIRLWYDELTPLGADWGDAIRSEFDQADVVLNVVTRAYIDSDHTKRELDALKRRHEGPSPPLIVSILAEDPAILIDGTFLATLQRVPREHGLFELDPTAREKVFNDLRNSLHTERAKRANVVSHELDGRAISEALLTHSLYFDLPTARKIIGVLEPRSQNRVQLLKITRAFVEYCLLFADDPTSPRTSDRYLGSDDALTKIVNAAEDRQTSAPPVERDFFLRAREREVLWARYFSWLHQNAGAEESMTVLTILVPGGYLSAQYLIAGLLAHFNDDWEPMLKSYGRIVGASRLGTQFQSLQMSQWNTWLLWGPSVPMCKCYLWRDVVAYQYGSGDENNSIPLVDITGTESLHHILGSFNQRHATALNAEVRLLWGPHYFRVDEGAAVGDEAALPETQPEDPLWEIFSAGDAQGSSRRLARAQAALCEGTPDGDDRPSHEGLMLSLGQLGSVGRGATQDRRADWILFAQNAERLYYTSYLWVMFLVTSSQPDPDHAPAPQLLRGKKYPQWHVDVEARYHEIRACRLWEDLLPVFVHANIADKNALGAQSEMLVATSLSVLRSVRQQADAMPGADAGIQFHLVCASDHTGCVEPIRYPPLLPLVERFRAALATEDPAFASAINLPTSSVDATPDVFKAFFSSCGLQLIARSYFDHLATGLK